MIIGSTIIGIYGIATMLLAVYYTWQIRNNLRTNERAALTAFFLRDEIIRSIKILPAAMVVFAVCMGLAAIGYYNQGTSLELLTEAPTFGSIVLFTALLYFCRTVATVTRDYVQ